MGQKGGKDTVNKPNYKTKSDACDGRMKFRGVNNIIFCYKYLFLDHISIRSVRYPMGPLVNQFVRARSFMLDHMPRGHLFAAGVLSLGVFAFSLTPSTNPSSTTETQYPSITIPGLEVTGTATPVTPIAVPSLKALIDPNAELETATVAEPEESPWKEFTVQTGDNLSVIFKRAGLTDRAIYELFDDSKEAKELRSIRAGQKMAFLVEDNQLVSLNYMVNRLESFQFERTTKGFVGKKTTLKPDVKYAFRQASIDSSLFMAGKRAGLPNTITMDLANIFGWDIDFALDIQKGDTFKVMYEEQFLAGKSIGAGKIMAAEFTNGGKTFQAVRYVDKDGVARYYTPEGRGMHKAFLRTPIEFARISSHFSLNRKHPVLHIIRAHKGTDYAAARGTPIRATGDGKVAFAGVKSGYGNVIILDHGQGYQTLYGHMNGFAKGMRSGTRVSQGDVIGYVGMTGLASGPHLHYEFHINGQVRNPVTVPLPQAMGVEKAEFAKFQAETKPLIAQLDQYKSSSRLAMVKTDETTH